MAAAYEVTNVTEDQIPDPDLPGEFLDVFDITFKVVGRPGEFTEQVPQGGQPVTAAFDTISAKAAEIQAIYAGSSS